MPDSLHWLGITKIDDLVSMSDMKYNAIVGSGIKVPVRCSQLSLTEYVWVFYEFMP
jgi:GTP cyclohydrolase II